MWQPWKVVVMVVGLTREPDDVEWSGGISVNEPVDLPVS